MQLTAKISGKHAGTSTLCAHSHLGRSFEQADGRAQHECYIA